MKSCLTACNKRCPSKDGKNGGYLLPSTPLPHVSAVWLTVGGVQGESSVHPSRAALERLSRDFSMPRVRVLRAAPEDVQDETAGLSVPHGSRGLWEAACDAFQVLL